MNIWTVTLIETIEGDQEVFPFVNCFGTEEAARAACQEDSDGMWSDVQDDADVAADKPALRWFQNDNDELHGEWPTNKQVEGENHIWVIKQTTLMA